MEGAASSSEAGRGPAAGLAAPLLPADPAVRRAARGCRRRPARRARWPARPGCWRVSRRRWHRSLQLRVVATTLVICVVVVAVLGFFLVQQIASGLLNSTRTPAAHQLGEGLTAAKDDVGLEGSAGRSGQVAARAGRRPAGPERAG